MTETTHLIPWRYRLGMWLAAYGRFGLGALGCRLMAGDIARRTAHLSHVERNTLLRRMNAEVTAEMEAMIEQNKKSR